MLQTQWNFFKEKEEKTKKRKKYKKSYQEQNQLP
jgi:hypothetical protein